MVRLFSKLKAIDFFKKIPSDLTEATLAGAWISIAAAILMTFLFAAELAAFLSTTTSTQLLVDRSPQNELLKLNFNISFPALSCEFATVDVSDMLGT
ncbi:Protein disulfide isomerase-like 5-4, partial [Tetrabaena socialis]